MKKMNMKKYSYTLETLSSLIISPRASLAFYEEVDYCVNDLKKDLDKNLKEYVNNELLNKLKIIYPFYQYGTYVEFDPINTSYYIPGSSIKGALLEYILNNKDKASNEKEIYVKSKGDIHLMVDDIPLLNSQITLRNIYKAQYLKSRKNANIKQETTQKDATNSKTNETADANQQENKPKDAIYEPFFDYIGIEMVKKGETLETGYFFTDDNITNILDNAEKSTIKKLKNMKNYIEQILKLDHNNITVKIKNELEKLKDNLNLIKNGYTSDKEYLILIGGYKGLLLSIEKTIEKKDTLDALVEENGGVYLDPETNLPYGLVKLRLKDK